MQTSNNVLDINDRNILWLGAISQTNSKVIRKIKRLPTNELTEDLRIKTLSALNMLARRIANDSKSREVVLVGVMRGGVTTTLLLREILERKRLKATILFLPTYRSTENTNYSIVSRASINLLDENHTEQKSFYLVDGWTGTGESLKRIKTDILNICENMRIIKTATLLDMHGSVDLIGSCDDFLIPHSFNYHSGLGIDIRGPHSTLTLPTIEVGYTDKMIYHEMEIMKKILGDTDSIPMFDMTTTPNSYSEQNLQLFREMRIGLGINEALHRHFREKQVICIPQRKLDVSLKKLLKLAGVTEYRVVSDTKINHVYSLKPTLLQQPSSFV